MSISNPITYAQNKEDLIINAYLKDIKKGFYVDIGASHPSHLSVTKYFYDKGWSGLNIEPDPKMIKLLLQERPRDINKQLGVSDKPGILKMRQYLGESQGLSTFSESMKNENNKSHKYVDVETQVQTLEKILDEQKVKNIDFMKVDVEGYEHNVLISNNWNKYRPKLLCIEANHIKEDWESILTLNGYEEVFFDGLNKYYLSKEVIKLKRNFSYAEDILASSAVPNRWMKEIGLKDAEIRKTLKQNEFLQADVNVYKTENLRLQREIIEQKRIISLLKQLVKSSDSVLRHRIEKLNKPKQRKNAKEIVFEPSQAKKSEELYKLIRANDLTNYFTNVQQKDRLSYRLVYKTYDSFSKSAFSFGKKALGVVRGRKHA